VLDLHGVEYLVIGGVAAQAYGAARPTLDFDCLVRRSADNFDRLASAMRELHARLRVEGLTDAESTELPVQIDGLTLSRSEISTWRTDAGALDFAGVSIRVAGLEAIIESKEWADRPKDHQALPELHRLRDRLGPVRE
jgi:hypothetical protein